MGRIRLGRRHRLPVAVPDDLSAWLVPAGSTRQRPASAPSKPRLRRALGRGAGGVVGALRLHGRGPVANGYKVHASGPFEVPPGDDEIVWVDLDLDFVVHGDEVELDDEAQFHDHARTMGYPDASSGVRWSGISTIAARYTNGDWPFDGTMQSGWTPRHGAMRSGRRGRSMHHADQEPGRAVRPRAAGLAADHRSAGEGGHDGARHRRAGPALGLDGDDQRRRVTPRERDRRALEERRVLVRDGEDPAGPEPGSRSAVHAEPGDPRSTSWSTARPRSSTTRRSWPNWRPSGPTTAGPARWTRAVWR